MQHHVYNVDKLISSISRSAFNHAQMDIIKIHHKLYIYAKLVQMDVHSAQIYQHAYNAGPIICP